MLLLLCFSQILDCVKHTWFFDRYNKLNYLKISIINMILQKSVYPFHLLGRGLLTLKRQGDFGVFTRIIERRAIFENNLSPYSTQSGSFVIDDNFKSVKYWTENNGRVAHLMLNRPERLNAIDLHMPLEIEKAIKLATVDDKVKVILLYGAGNAFCSGYDLKLFSEGKRGEMMGNQEMPWCPLVDFRAMSQCTSSFMEIWRCPKPVIGKIKRVAIGGGSDIALACDVTFIEDSALIGYPPSRVWGCPTTAFWFYRIGMERAKRILFSGEILTGQKAAEIGLIGESVEGEKLDEAVDDFISRLVTVPSNQLWFQKQMINQAVESMGLGTTQRLATIFDGMSRHTPEGVKFQERAAAVGFKKAVQERDSGEEAEWSNREK